MLFTLIFFFLMPADDSFRPVDVRATLHGIWFRWQNEGYAGTKCLYEESELHGLPNQELSGAKSELQGRTVGVCSSYERSGQPPYNLSFSPPSVYTTQSRIIGAIRGAHSQLRETTLPVFSLYAPRKYDMRFGTPAIVWFTGRNYTYMPNVWFTGRKNPYTLNVTAIIDIAIKSRKKSYVLLYAFSLHSFYS